MRESKDIRVFVTFRNIHQIRYVKRENKDETRKFAEFAANIARDTILLNFLYLSGAENVNLVDVDFFFCKMIPYRTCAHSPEPDLQSFF